MKFDINQIIRLTKESKGLVFDSPYLMNIVGVRDLTNPDSWNDYLIYYYWDKSHKLIMNVIDNYTTDPGIKMLKNPINKLGTAILSEGWHYRLWILGQHKGYEALQQYSKCKVYRDNNKDSNFDLDPRTFNEGHFGINLHRAALWSDTPVVGAYSAGCQVIRKNKDWEKFLEHLKLCKRLGNQKYFSYMLIDINKL